jgi:hypothetical protein
LMAMIWRSWVVVKFDILVIAEFVMWGGAGVNHGVFGPESILPASPVSSKNPGVQPNRPENLDDLLGQAEHYANHSMRDIGHLPPTLFLRIIHGLQLFFRNNTAPTSESLWRCLAISVGF